MISKVKRTHYVVGGLAVAGLLYLVLRRRSFGPPVTPPPLPEQVEDGPTLPAPALRSMAEAIYSALYGDGSCWGGTFDEDEAAVVDIVTQCGNDADVYYLADYYGRRSGCWLWSPTAYDLAGALRQFLGASDLAVINDDFSRKGIKYRF